MEARPEEELSPPLHSTGAEPPSASDALAWGPLDQALRAYHAGDRGAIVVMRTDVGGSEDVPVELFFRGEEEMPEVEREALARCGGAILDVGAGVGAMSVPLGARGLTVAALEILPAAREILRARGVRVLEDWAEATTQGPWDTVLVMMNGLGLARTRAGVPDFLARLSELLAQGGRILVDSTDPGDWDQDDDGRAPGEVHMQLGHAGRWGTPFPFVFLSPTELTAAAAEAGLHAEVLRVDPDGRWLASVGRGAG